MHLDKNSPVRRTSGEAQAKLITCAVVPAVVLYVASPVESLWWAHFEVPKSAIYKQNERTNKCHDVYHSGRSNSTKI